MLGPSFWRHYSTEDQHWIGQRFTSLVDDLMFCTILGFVHFYVHTMFGGDCEVCDDILLACLLVIMHMVEVRPPMLLLQCCVTVKMLLIYSSSLPPVDSV